MSNLSADYEIRRFQAAATDDPAYAESVAWMRAVAFGIHDARRSDERVDKSIELQRTDGRVLTGVYQVGTVAGHSLGADVPVATFGTMTKTLNIGFGRLLDTRLVTAVTVRTSHRRRGLLRRMMGEALAREEGLAMAALTASEASIYGRFGFGVATSEQGREDGHHGGFPAQPHPGGQRRGGRPQSAAGPGSGGLRPPAPQHARIHRPARVLPAVRLGIRQPRRGRRPEGQGGVALRAGGDVDGYVSYRFAGWSSTPYTMEVVDLVAATGAAYLELWQYLAAIDLVDRITWEEAPVDDTLRWALEDARCVEASEARDMLWLRILDVKRALEARHYPADGRLVLNVADSLGLTGGTFTVDAEGGGAVVTSGGGGAPDLELDVAALSAIYLGGVSPVTLAASGRILEHTPGAAFRAARMFAVERPPHCLTHF
ncbi:GNAT family N-acetyltransferase [Arthrobacter sp. FW305-BF8]|uniref:GNAT family N-acetyltransferase n=1 Tax=Arthrobacter sp. FW305-BF8 TaxID=2879617 RepID=UPI003015BAC9